MSEKLHAPGARGSRTVDSRPPTRPLCTISNAFAGHRTRRRRQSYVGTHTPRCKFRQHDVQIRNIRRGIRVADSFNVLEKDDGRARPCDVRQHPMEGLSGATTAARLQEQRPAPGQGLPRRGQPREVLARRTTHKDVARWHRARAAMRCTHCMRGPDVCDVLNMHGRTLWPES